MPSGFLQATCLGPNLLPAAVPITSKIIPRTAASRSLWILEHASECTALCGAPQLHLRASKQQLTQPPVMSCRCLHLCWSASSKSLAEQSGGDHTQAPPSTVAPEDLLAYTGSAQPASTLQVKYSQLGKHALHLIA